MTTWFDESRLDDESALAGIDLRLRSLAESGSRVRRDAGAAADDFRQALEWGRELTRPRAVVAAGPDSRLLRAVLEQWCPVPFVAWPAAALPGWAGSLDLVVVLAPDGSDTATASAVAEAVRRGCQVVVACPPGSLVAEHAAGRWAAVLPVETGDPLSAAVLMMAYLSEASLGPEAEPEGVASALDEVALACSPHRDLAVNPAKSLAIALADANPLVWGGSVLAARAARRVAESVRRTSGRSALAGDAEHLLPVITAARPRNVFDDPFADQGVEARPLLLLLDDGNAEGVTSEQEERLREAAAEHGVRVEILEARTGSEVGRYASLLLQGTYAAEYLRLGLVDD